MKRRGDCGKRSYKTFKAAEKIRLKMPNAFVLHSYECPKCGSFHIGHVLGWGRLQG